MKKYLLLGTGLMAISAFAFGGLMTVDAPLTTNAFAQEEVEKYIPFNDANFTFHSTQLSEGQEELKPSAYTTDRYGTFWNYRYFNAMDNFYDGNRHETWTGTITSKSFVQTEDYITFTLGGGRPQMNGETTQNRVEIKTVEGDEVVKTITNDQFNDPYLSVNMITKVVEIPSEYQGQQLYLQIIDERTGGFGMVTFGALQVNQNVDDVVKSVAAHIEDLRNVIDLNNTTHYPYNPYDGEHAIPSEGLDANANYNTRASDYIIDVYRTADEYSVVRENGLTINEDDTYSTNITNLNEGFEEGHLLDWAYDLSFSARDVVYSGEAQEGETAPTTTLNQPYYIPFANAISSEEHAPWAEHMPYNKTDDKFYRGWDNGFVETEKYRLLSPAFTLSGNGLISIKMAGNSSAVQVLDADSHELLYQVTNKAFYDNVDSVRKNGRLNTMTRHIIDLSDYLGQKIIIALADYRTDGNWGCVFFDELVTYYDTLPSFKLDVINQNGTISGENVNLYGVVKDIYVEDSTLDDENTSNDVMKEAYDFMSQYYSTLRSTENGFTYCSMINDINAELYNEVKQLLETTYSNLSEQAQEIVSNSMDYSYCGDVYTTEIDLCEVSDTMSYINSQLSTNGLSATLELSSSIKDSTIIIVGVLSLSIIAFALIYISKKKKTNRG